MAASRHRMPLRAQGHASSDDGGLAVAMGRAELTSAAGWAASGACLKRPGLFFGTRSEFDRAWAALHED